MRFFSPIPLFKNVAYQNVCVDRVTNCTYSRVYTVNTRVENGTAFSCFPSNLFFLVLGARSGEEENAAKLLVLVVAYLNFAFNSEFRDITPVLNIYTRYGLGILNTSELLYGAPREG